MNKELEKKFREFLAKYYPALPKPHVIISWINEHFKARSEIQEDLKKMKLIPKADLLSMVGEDESAGNMPGGDSLARYNREMGYNQAKQEIRDKIEKL